MANMLQHQPQSTAPMARRGCARDFLGGGSCLQQSQAHGKQGSLATGKGTGPTYNWERPGMHRGRDSKSLNQCEADRPGRLRRYFPESPWPSPSAVHHLLTLEVDVPSFEPVTVVPPINRQEDRLGGRALRAAFPAPINASHRRTERPLPTPKRTTIGCAHCAPAPMKTHIIHPPTARGSCPANMCKT